MCCFWLHQTKPKLLNAYFIWLLGADKQPKDEETEEDNKIPQDEVAESKLKIQNLKTKSVGAQISIEWDVEGDSNEVRAYQIEQQSKGSDQWRQAGNYVPNNPAQNAYKQLIDYSALANKHVEIRVKAIGPDGNSLAQSQIAQLSGECESKF